MLEMLADIMKHGDTQRMPTETVFTDGKISTACIVTVLPNARHFICAWHIYTMNLEKHFASEVPCSECIVDSDHSNLYQISRGSLNGRIGGDSFSECANIEVPFA